jgi:F0F1-type ATP synthase assembly protein I
MDSQAAFPVRKSAENLPATPQRLMPNDPASQPTLTSAANRSAGSFELVLGPVLMALIGLAIDKALGTTPLFILLFTFWGAAGAAVGIYYRYRRQMAQTP